jgi:hypothetical protein
MKIGNDIWTLTRTQAPLFLVNPNNVVGVVVLPEKRLQNAVIHCRNDNILERMTNEMELKIIRQHQSLQFVVNIKNV